MQINFQKYHGTGNDFIMIDNRLGQFDGSNQALIAKLCDRHFGIGADGLILLEKSEKHDFAMHYYNADGLEGSMCGNGGRCTVHFAESLGIVEQKTTFEAVDGLHFATINGDIVSLQMSDVEKIEIFANHCFLNTGSPHHVEIVENINDYPVVEIGKIKRYGAPYFEKGSNINFVAPLGDNIFKLRTYERGVENETLSCGTGATATAIAMYETGKTKSNKVRLEVMGGILEVSFEKVGNTYQNVFLTGKATFVFEGKFVG
jgi:diaminopimelate epimerase